MSWTGSSSTPWHWLAFFSLILSAIYLMAKTKIAIANEDLIYKCYDEDIKIKAHH
jgi:hypothetical protein